MGDSDDYTVSKIFFNISLYINFIMFMIICVFIFLSRNKNIATDKKNMSSQTNGIDQVLIYIDPNEDIGIAGIEHD